MSLPEAEKDAAYSDDADIAPAGGTELDQLAAHAVEAAAQLARTGNAWMRFKSALGSLIMSFGQWLSKDFYDARDQRDARTSQAFTRLQQSMRGATPGSPRNDAKPSTSAVTPVSPE